MPFWHRLIVVGAVLLVSIVVARLIDRRIARRELSREAMTRYRVEQRFRDYAALIECRLLTGRTHQIRVHLAHIGHPLIGDPAYGTRAGRAVTRTGNVGAEIATFARQALHARLLGFTHPTSGDRLRFESSLPADMTTLLSNLERL